MKFTRKELYDLVWSKPLTTIAKEHAIPDTLIRKVCKRQSIPLPEAGHWQRVQHQKPLFIKELSNENFNPLIDFAPLIADRTKRLAGRLNSPAMNQQISDQSIKINSRLVNLEPEIQLAQAAFKNEKAYYYSRHPGIIATPREVVNISASKDLQHRALVFMDTFLKLVKKEGYVLKLYNAEIMLEKDGIHFQINCREKANAEVVKREHWNSRKYSPSGIMTFRLEYRYSRKREWKDGKLKIEEQYPSILTWLTTSLDEIKIEEEQWRVERQQNELRRHREHEEALRKQQEKERVDLLLKNSEQWKKADDLLKFIQTVERRNEVDPNPAISSWIEWAKACQKQLDPLTGNLGDFVTKFGPEDTD